jgi:hypothetical protein
LHTIEPVLAGVDHQPFEGWSIIGTTAKTGVDIFVEYFPFWDLGISFQSGYLGFDGNTLCLLFP